MVTYNLRTRLDNAVRVSLAVVTEGVTVAPLQGVNDVQLKNNVDGSQYLSVSFAGPIRSAGGTRSRTNDVDSGPYSKSCWRRQIYCKLL